MKKVKLCLYLAFFIPGIALFGQESSSIFSDVEYFGDTVNYELADSWLWDVFVDSTKMDKVFGIVEENEAGGLRQAMVKDKSYEHDLFVEADVKLFKRATGGTNTPLFEDAELYFAYTDADNYAKAFFCNTSGQGVAGHPQGAADVYGISGIKFMHAGQLYRVTKTDAPGDDIDEIPAESAIPFVDDASFDEWNNIRLERKGAVLTMLVNSEVYFAVDLDTLSNVEIYGGDGFQDWQFNQLVALPEEAKALLLGSGQVGIGSANDKVYFDNVSVGYIEVEGTFSDIEYFGDAASYTEINPWLWGVLEEDGDTRYGITAPRDSGGVRSSIVKDKSYEDDLFVEADVKLFKRATGGTNTPLFEDAELYFAYTDADNYAKAFFCNTSGQGVAGHSQGAADVYGISGITFMHAGQLYRISKTDAPADDVEEIPAESAIPFVDDASFDEWNNIKLERKETVLSMLVNGEVYFAVDLDTLTNVEMYGGDDFQDWQFNQLGALPEEAKAMLLGSGQVGIGSANDQVYFDNVNAGALTTDNVFNLNEKQSINVYPNPATDHVIIDGIEDFNHMVIYSISGRKIIEQSINATGKVVVETSQFKSGVYFIQLSSQNGTWSADKFIIR